MGWVQQTIGKGREVFGVIVAKSIGGESSVRGVNRPESASVRIRIGISPQACSRSNFYVGLTITRLPNVQQHAALTLPGRALLPALSVVILFSCTTAKLLS